MPPASRMAVWLDSSTARVGQRLGRDLRHPRLGAPLQQLHQALHIGQASSRSRAFVGINDFSYWQDHGWDLIM